MASLAFMPGSQLGIVEHRLDFEKAHQIGGFRRRPWTSACQEKFAGLSAFTWSSVLARERQRPDHVVEREWPDCTPSSPNCSARIDAAQARIGGQDLNQTLRLCQHRHLRLELVGRLEQQDRSAAKKAPPCGSSIERKKFFCCAASPTSAAVASWTSSGVGASTTATISVELRKGLFEHQFRAAARAVAGEMSWLISVVMEKCVAAYQTDAIARQNSAAR